MFYVYLNISKIVSNITNKCNKYVYKYHIIAEVIIIFSLTFNYFKNKLLLYLKFQETLNNDNEYLRNHD